MAIEDMLSIWFKFWGKKARKVSFKDKDALKNLDLTEAQFRWLLVGYRKYKPYPTIADFNIFAEDELKEDCVPENLACMAYLSRKPALVNIAIKLEANTGAFFPSDKTRKRALELREQLGNALI